MNAPTHLWLLDMPAHILHGDARGIEEWCRENNKCRPSLLARAAKPRR